MGGFWAATGPSISVFISFGFLVWVETQKGRKRCASGPSAGWWLLVVWLLPLPIVEVLLAAFTAPERVSRVRWIGTHDVDMGSIEHFLASGHVSAITARKAHLRRHTLHSKDGWHRLTPASTRSLPPSSRCNDCSEPCSGANSTSGHPPQVFRIRGRTGSQGTG